MPDRIAIVGAHPATKLLAPYFDTAWAIWACSPKNESELPRHDLWFELHPLAFVHSNPVYCDWLKRQPAVMMQEAFADFPGAQAYPVGRATHAFGFFYFTSSIAYMMALALLQSPRTIGLWGIAASDEYQWQKPSIQYFIQRAAERGVAVAVPTGHEYLLAGPRMIPGEVDW